MNPNEYGNCRLCGASMTIYQKNCPKCNAPQEECFISKAQQKANIKAVRAKIIDNIICAFKERRW